MPLAAALSDKSRLAVLLDHLSAIDDPRDVRRISHPLAEILLLVACGTIADCDDYDHIAAWGGAHLAFLRRHLPFEHGTPGGRWLTILMNRINPALLARLAEQDGLRGALVSIDAIATNSTVAQAVRNAGADYLLAVEANQPTLRAEVEACFTAAPPGMLDTDTTHDKGHGRIERRTTSVVREINWLSGQRRFPGELRLPDAACIVRVQARTERGSKTHEETRYYIASTPLDAARAGQAVRGHWGIENRPTGCWM